MKRLLLAIIIATTLAVSIGLISYYYGPGYVVFSFADLSIESSFIFLLGFLAVSFFLFHYLIRLLSIFLRIPGYLGFRYNNRQAEKARNALVKGLIEMSEGRFIQAEKILLKQVQHSDTGLLNYLMAARAAQQLGAYDRRDEYLRLAHESTPSAEIAIGITQAELQLAHKQYEQALATLNYLNQITPKHGYVKKLQARVYQQLGDWDSLHQLLHELKKHNFIDNDKLETIELETYSGLLAQAVKIGNKDKISRIWQQLPKKLKKNSSLLLNYIQYLMEQNQDNEAETLLRNYLTDHWNESMVALYAQLNTTNTLNQIETAETWLLGHNRSVILLTILGKLCIKQSLWGKARTYLETSIDISPTAEAYLLLAQLLEEKMNEKNKAQSLYKEGLKIALSNKDADKQGSSLASDSTKNLTPTLKLIQ
ncbi:MAG: heme biosynthesis protein HemY [Gammaproteobacteria bacterium]|nr:heme biosynthesis protein HemY [Gammaproteobacteria bacterium]MDH5735171.1 heme biosynthesis protein HemY [Gammaproteobacteria bacterium]